MKMLVRVVVAVNEFYLFVRELLVCSRPLKLRGCEVPCFRLLQEPVFLVQFLILRKNLTHCRLDNELSTMYQRYILKIQK